MDKRPQAIFLMGPTASGKTDLALQLVEALPCEIISVDSVMIYRGMDIGSAKPDADTLRRAPHRLIDICDPSESYSAAQFSQDALREMEDIQRQGKIPLLVGGTFLYFRALEKGLSPLPSADANIRTMLEQQAEDIGWNTMHERLRKVDPETAERVHPNDPQRIQRALEVYAITGQPMSSLLGVEPTAEFPYRVTKLILAPGERADLHEKIAVRFRTMLELGFVDEVRGLYQRGDLHQDMPAIRAVGYRQIWDFLTGNTKYEEMVERGIIATRQYAKRQITWLRSEQNGVWFDALSTSVVADVLKTLEQGAI